MERKGTAVIERTVKNLGATHVKVLDAAEGVVEAIVSATGVVDSVKDIIEPGAYGKTLANRTPKVIWAHDWSMPIGKTLEAEELQPNDPKLPQNLRDMGAGGLYVKAQFNMGSEAGREAYAAVAFYGEDQEWSIGYVVKPGDYSIDSETGVRHITNLDLYEYSPVLFGANPYTATMAAKGVDIVVKGDLDNVGNGEWEATPGTANTTGDADTGAPDVVDDTTQTAADTTLPPEDPEDAHQVEAQAAGTETKAQVHVEGSVEAVQAAMYQAYFQWAMTEDVGTGGFLTAMTEATFPSEHRAIFLTLGWEDSYDGGTFYEALYLDDDVTLKDTPQPVQIVGQVRREAVAVEASVVASLLDTKEGRVLSTRNYARLQEAQERLQAVIEAATPVEADGEKDDPEKPEMVALTAAELSTYTAVRLGAPIIGV